MRIKNEKLLQLRAALLLWQELEATSRVKPADLPAIREFYKQHESFPLSADERKQMFAALTRQVEWFGDVDLAALLGTDRRGLIRKNKETGLKKRRICGNLFAFHIDDILRVYGDELEAPEIYTAYDRQA